MNIRQCIPADRSRAATFLEGLPQRPAALEQAFALSLSLIAGEDDATEGVALCVPVSGVNLHVLYVAVTQGRDELLQSLIDKALTKLHSQGIHKCRVTVLQGREPAVLWNQSRWSGTMSEGAAAGGEKPAKKGAKKSKPKAEAAAA